MSEFSRLRGSEGYEACDDAVNRVIKTARTWLKPLCRALKKYLLELGVIYADETVVQVLKEDGKPASSESRMWVYASNDRSGRPIRYFEYQPDRSGKHAAAFLKGFTGCNPNREPSIAGRGWKGGAAE